MRKRRFLTPFQKFVNTESLSGVLLAAATVVALVWANSPFGESYRSLWEYQLGISSEGYGLVKPLILWVNDGLMAIFFFLIGLEIKREITIGELNSLRKATFPIFAAIGGIVIPLALYLLLNDKAATRDGWGIPMATDIAFSLAIIKALGKAVPLGLKVFLTAFAIVDDLCAVSIIAIFYSGGVKWSFVGVSLALLLLLFLLGRRGVYIKYLTLGVAVVIWYLFLKSGIHPTIAGVLVAFTVPIKQGLDTGNFVEQLRVVTANIAASAQPASNVLTKEQIAHIDTMEGLVDQFQSPLQRLEHQLHGWVAYLIMPIFALANAGVLISSGMDLDTALLVNIAAALFVGKFLGISLFSWLALQLGVAELPERVRFVQVIGVAILAGVGFTMSIFIANLAFGDNPVFVDSAKIGILIGSVVSGIVGAVILKRSGSKSAALAAQ